MTFVLPNAFLLAMACGAELKAVGVPYFCSASNKVL